MRHIRATCQILDTVFRDVYYGKTEQHPEHDNSIAEFRAFLYVQNRSNHSNSTMFLQVCENPYQIYCAFGAAQVPYKTPTS